VRTDDGLLWDALECHPGEERRLLDASFAMSRRGPAAAFGGIVGRRRRTPELQIVQAGLARRGAVSVIRIGDAVQRTRHLDVVVLRGRRHRVAVLSFERFLDAVLFGFVEIQAGLGGRLAEGPFKVRALRQLFLLAHHLRGVVQLDVHPGYVEDGEVDQRGVRGGSQARRTRLPQELVFVASGRIWTARRRRKLEQTRRTTPVLPHATPAGQHNTRGLDKTRSRDPYNLISSSLTGSLVWRTHFPLLMNTLTSSSRSMLGSCAFWGPED
jgi:hypothetical protein